MPKYSRRESETTQTDRILHYLYVFICMIKWQSSKNNFFNRKIFFLFYNFIISIFFLKDLLLITIIKINFFYLLLTLILMLSNFINEGVDELVDLSIVALHIVLLLLSPILYHVIIIYQSPQ